MAKKRRQPTSGLTPIQVATLQMVERLVDGICKNTMMGVYDACKTIRWATYVIEGRQHDTEKKGRTDGSEA